MQTTKTAEKNRLQQQSRNRKLDRDLAEARQHRTHPLPANSDPVDCDSGGQALEFPSRTEAVLPDLGQSGFLYVGGRPSTEPHLCDLVDNTNGRIRFHDGGLNDSLVKLRGDVATCDIAVCPINCISHSAIGIVKKQCRWFDCPFVALRQSSPAALKRVLAGFGETVASKG